jgi:hypothetical protein
MLRYKQYEDQQTNNELQKDAKMEKKRTKAKDNAQFEAACDEDITASSPVKSRSGPAQHL